MIIKGVQMLVTSVNLKKATEKGKDDYCMVGLLSMDDGQSYEVIVRDEDIYKSLVPMKKADCDLTLTNTKSYGLKLAINKIVQKGEKI